MVQTANTLKHPYLKIEVEARLFQQTILSTCIANNTLVVLPTGTGKTMITILHLAYLLQKGILEQAQDNYALFLAPTKPLISQHTQSLRKFLNIPAQQIVELSGEIRPEKRVHLEKNGLIYVTTPQTIKNDIFKGNLQLENCKVVYFDEAHRATGEYDYVPIATLLMEKNPDARILALSASPGTKKERIIEICRNLFIQEIECRSKNNPEIKEYVQEVDIEKIEVPLPQSFDEVLSYITELGNQETMFLKHKNVFDKSFNYTYKGEILKLKKELSKQFKQNYLTIMSCNRLIYLIILRETLESQGIPSAFILLNNWIEKKSKSIKGLLKKQRFQQVHKRIIELNDQGILHPKISYLLEILNNTKLETNRVLIFCNLRATAYSISKVLNEQGIPTKAFVGQKRGKTKGLSQEKQKTLLQAFRGNIFPVLVSTSVLEEGLDVEDCNLVIFYDATASAIRRIQRAGRTGRKKKGKIVMLTTHHTNDTSLHYIAQAKEQQMVKLLKNIDWLKEELKKKDHKNYQVFNPQNLTITKEKESTPISDDEKTTNSKEKPNKSRVSTKLLSFKEAQETLRKWSTKTETDKKSEKELKNGKKRDKQKEITIIIDTREKNSKVLMYLMKEGIKLDFQQMQTGDYIVSDRIAVEYKKGEDLLASIIDGRLFDQIGLLTNAYQIPLLIIEGFATGGIHPEAIAGALASLMIDFGISIIQTQSSEETAVILKRLAIREQKTKRRKAYIRTARKMGNPNENAIQILSAFPGINRTIANRLLEEFSSVKKVVNTTQEELQKVNGLGEKKSEIITTIVTKKYE
ncbi:MAG: helicase-related protein [Asgard group archaeon]|nr:helicase-related protein [Asgard group archaeon]